MDRPILDRDGEYITSETPLAAYLTQEGFDVLIITYADSPNGKPRAFYHFTDCQQLRQLVSLYNRGEATINIALYEHAKNGLLDRIHRGLP